MFPVPDRQKFEAFNFHTININGNDFDEIRAAFAGGAGDQGNADGDYRKDIKGKRCFIHGECR